MDQPQAPFGAFSGTIDLIQLADLIQLGCLAGMDLSIEVESGPAKGSIQVRSGRVSNASAGSLAGEEALFDMLRWKGGRFATYPLEEGAVSSIKRSWEYLLIEAMRLRDELEGAFKGGGVGTEGSLSLDASYGFSGTIQQIQLTDLIQLCCIAPMDRVIEVESEPGSGRLHISSGQVRHARVDELEGEGALFKIISWTSGRFAAYLQQEAEIVSVTRPWDVLLLEAVRLQDETTHAGKDEEEQEESLFQKVQKMKVVEKVRLAMRGDKEARGLLLRDPTKIVQFAIVSNPRITEGEVAAIAHSRSIDEEVLRKIAGSREWMKLYPIRLALAKNPKTPLSISIKLVQTLMLQDLKQISKSKAVPTAVAQAARRIVTTRQE